MASIIPSFAVPTYQVNLHIVDLFWVVTFNSIPIKLKGFEFNFHRIAILSAVPSSWRLIGQLYNSRVPMNRSASSFLTLPHLARDSASRAVTRGHTCSFHTRTLQQCNLNIDFNPLISLDKSKNLRAHQQNTLLFNKHVLSRTNTCWRHHC